MDPSFLELGYGGENGKKLHHLADLADGLCALKGKENPYACRDYFGELIEDVDMTGDNDNGSSSNSSSDRNSFRSVSTATTRVDESCRSKMAEWYFGVVDHIGIEREVAVVAMSFLDRFLARVNEVRDRRKVYKIAAATSLVAAVKAHDPRRLKKLHAYLPLLNRGEFDMRHVSAMELILLRTLQWRLNPPTPRRYIEHFLAFLSCCTDLGGGKPSTAVLEGIYDTAVFCTEMSLFDYFFVTKSQSQIALAAVQIAMEDFPDLDMSKSAKATFATSLAYHCPELRCDPREIDGVRSRLYEIRSSNQAWSESSNQASGEASPTSSAKRFV